MHEFGIIADDLTGALDTGVQFSKQGLHTIVVTGRYGPQECDVLAIDTESRADPPQKAYTKAREASRQVNARHVYKKIDSTLRGNVGRELDAVMDELDLEKALVAPAFPASGRTIVEGRLFLDGLPLTKTSFAADPLCPSTEDVPALLRRQTKRRVGHVSAGTISRGPEHLAEELCRDHREILVIDASQDSHLRCIAEAAFLVQDCCLVSGSAGLAHELPAAFHLKGKRPVKRLRPQCDLPVLVVAGSRHHVNVEQLTEAQRELRARIVKPEITRLADKKKRSAEILRVADEIDFWLANGRDVVLTSVFADYVPEMDAEVGKALADITKLAVAGEDLAGLILTGGDTAIRTCRALRIASIQVEEEVSLGIPLGIALAGPYVGLRVVTKAGAFGDMKAIAKSIRHLKGCAHE